MLPLVLFSFLLVSPSYGAPKVYNISLSETNTLHWSLDYARRLVKFEVHVTQDSPTSWFAIGFSDYGATEQGDFCLYWVDWKRNHYLQDITTDEFGRIHIDRKQDCTHFHYMINGKLLKFTFWREFNTCDADDYVIEDGTTHVVWVEGKGPLYRPDGLDINSHTTKDFQRVQLLVNEGSNTQLASDSWSMDFLMEKVRVPADDTTYWCHVFTLPESFATKHHVIQYEADISKGSEDLVHHMELFHCSAPVTFDIPAYSGSCFSPDRPDATQVCKRVLSAWAVGAAPFAYPQEAGLPIGGPNFNRHVMLEIHYNNPNLRKGIVDSSGIRLHVTKTLRPYDGSVMELGLEYTDKMAIPPGQAGFPLSGHCITECTAVSLPEQGIVVFGSQLHSHMTGVTIFTKHFRNGRELPELNRDNHYSQHFQQIRLLKRPVLVLPGDALITTCIYNTLDRTNVTLGGFGISEEMCVNYIHYYPKVNLEVCKSSISEADLHGYFDFLRKWDGQMEVYPNGAISKNYYAVDWTPMRVQVLDDYYSRSTLSMQCNQSSGERFSGNWEGLPQPTVVEKLITVDECATKN